MLKIAPENDAMKNGFTPRQYAYTVATDALFYAEHNRFGELDELTPAERLAVIDQLQKLRAALQTKARLDSHQ